MTARNNFDGLNVSAPSYGRRYDWKRPNEEGVVYYLKNGRVRGVLLWNVWEQVEAARKLIAEPGPLAHESLKGRLPVKQPSQAS